MQNVRLGNLLGGGVGGEQEIGLKRYQSHVKVTVIIKLLTSNHSSQLYVRHCLRSFASVNVFNSQPNNVDAIIIST